MVSVCAVLACAVLACSSGGTGTIPESAGRPAETAGTCTGRGASYDVARSKFAFGGTPTAEPYGGGTRWTGPDGVIVITGQGSVRGIMNARAAESSVADWSGDPDALTAHVREYFVGHGVLECQILRTTVMAGSFGRVIHLQRGFDGVTAVESRAYARMSANDRTTLEGLYWPTLPDGVISAARAFRDQLADPNALAQYRAKLPPNAQGNGAVTLHHTSDVVLTGETKPFRAAPTWDVMLSDSGTTGVPVSFDVNGAPIEERW